MPAKKPDVGSGDTDGMGAYGCCCRIDELRRPDSALLLLQAMVVQVPLLPPQLRRLCALPVPLQRAVVHVLCHHKPARKKTT